MKKTIVSGMSLLSVLLLCQDQSHSAPTPPPASKVEYVSGFPNSNHPEICYWFITPDQLKNDRYMAQIDQLADKGLYTMVFLTARNGVDFYNTEELHPVFAKLVDHAHQRGLKIGLQLWPQKYKDLPLKDCERLIVEGEATLDENGAATYTAHARNGRSGQQVIKSDLLRAYAFTRTGDGFYDPATLRDVTDKCVVRSTGNDSLQVEIKTDSSMKGKTVYLMTQHYYNYASGHSPVAPKISGRCCTPIATYRSTAWPSMNSTTCPSPHHGS